VLDLADVGPAELEKKDGCTQVKHTLHVLVGGASTSQPWRGVRKATLWLLVKKVTHLGFHVSESPGDALLWATSVGFTANKHPLGKFCKKSRVFE